MAIKLLGNIVLVKNPLSEYIGGDNKLMSGIWIYMFCAKVYFLRKTFDIGLQKEGY